MIVTKFGFSQQKFIKILNIKFHENVSSASGQMDGQT